MRCQYITAYTQYTRIQYINTCSYDLKLVDEKFIPVNLEFSKRYSYLIPILLLKSQSFSKRYSYSMQYSYSILESRQLTEGKRGYSGYADFFSYPYLSLFSLRSLSSQMFLLFPKFCSADTLSSQQRIFYVQTRCE